MLVDLSLNPIVKTVLSPDTTGDIQSIVNLIRKIGVRRYYIIHMDVLRKEELIMQNTIDYTAFLGFYQKIQRENPDIAVHRVNASCFDSNSLPPGVRCAGGVRKLSVMPDGAVYPVQPVSWTRRIQAREYFQRQILKTSGQIGDSICSEDTGKTAAAFIPAKIMTSCTGGCPAHGIYHYGNSDATDIRCSSARSREPSTDNLCL